MLQDGSDSIRRIVAESEIVPFTPGYVLSERWEIVARIGKGGFGFVYSARDLELDVEVAIKVLRPEHETRSAAIAQFKTEIQLARQVTHKNVCRIYDVGFYEQGSLRVPFLTMELLEGKPLDELLREDEPLSLEEIEVITRQVVLALEAAHNAGIVHADLKPANIMIMGRGAQTRAVVADFGLASAHSTAVRREEHSPVVGTPAYMAPEQVEGRKLGPAADYYALGCTLYQVIGGQLPFHADTPVATARARLLGPAPALIPLDKNLPAKWLHLVRDLMEIDPAKRLTSGPAIRKRLRRSSRRDYLITAILLLGAGIGTWFYLVPDAAKTVTITPFELSLPSDPQTRAVYQSGLTQWHQFQTVEAVETWQVAIDAGHNHPRLLLRLCTALVELNQLRRAASCAADAHAAAESLGEDEELFYAANHWLTAGKTIKAANGLYELLDRHPGDYEIARLLSSAQKRQKEYEDAIETLDQVGETSEENAVRLGNDKITILIQSRKFKRAKAEALALLPVAIRLDIQRETLSVLDSLAAATRNLGELSESRRYGQQSLELAKRLGSIRMEANALSSLNAVAMQRYEYARATELVTLREARLRDNQDKLAGHQMAITRAEILLNTGHPQEALELISAVALPNLRADNNTYWVAYALIVQSQIRRILSLPVLAIEDCSNAEVLFRSIKNPRLESFAQVVCAETLIDVRRFDEARVLLAKARAARTKAKLNIKLLQSGLLDGKLLLADGEAAKALEIASTVAREFEGKNLASQEVNAQILLLQAALTLDDQVRALEAFERATSLGIGENRRLDLVLRLAEIQLQERDEEVRSERLESLRGEARTLGYERLANQVSKTIEAL